MLLMLLLLCSKLALCLIINLNLMTLQQEQRRLKRCFCTGGCKACKPHVREQCIRDPRTNQPFVLLEDSQDAALAVTSYDDNSTTGAGSLSTSTKKQRTNQGTAQATGYKSAVQQPTRPNPRAYRMKVFGTPDDLLKGIVLGQDPGDYALASYCAGAPPGAPARIPPELGQPGSASQCWTRGCNGQNPNSTEVHTQWTKCHMAKLWFANLGKQQRQQVYPNSNPRSNKRRWNA